MTSRSASWVILAIAFVAAACDPGASTPSSLTSMPTVNSTSTTASVATTSPIDATTTSVEASPPAYVVWTSGGLTEGMTEALLDTFATDITIVTGDAALLDVGGGLVIPLDAIGIDLNSYGWYDRDGITSALVPGTVLLGESSAAFRGVDIGHVLVFDGAEFEVAGIVPDELVGAAEVVFAQEDPSAPVATTRYALISTDMNRAEFEELVENVNDSPVPVRVRAEGETLFLRHADGVLPQIYIKMALGEFSYPRDSGPRLEQDASFIEENIVTAEVPILGSITCHRVVVEMARGALAQVVNEGLEDLVDPGDFAGCWKPRFVRTVTGAPSGLSRHSWGAALDINASTNGMGVVGDQDERLVAIMKEWGFLWGGDWEVPDAMHFEYGILPED